MPAGISTATHSGGNAIYLNTPAWHRLGAVASESEYPDGFTPHQAQTLAGTLFTVSTTRAAAWIDGEWREQGGYRFTKRDDTEAVFAPVTADYRTIQNEQPMNFLGQVASDRSEAGIVAHAALLDGRRLFAVLELKRLKGMRVPFDPSRHDAYLVAQWWHDGTGAFTVTPSVVRVECQNMANANLAQAERRGRLVRIPHVGDTTAGLAEAQRVLGFAEQRVEGFMALMERLADTPITDPGWIDGFTQRLIPVPAEMERPALRVASREAIKALYESSSTMVGLYPSAYRAYNAVTEFTDHYRSVRTKDPVLVPAKHFTSVVDGPGADVKATALALLRQEFEL